MAYPAEKMQFPGIIGQNLKFSGNFPGNKIHLDWQSNDKYVVRPAVMLLTAVLIKSQVLKYCRVHELAWASRFQEQG